MELGLRTAKALLEVEALKFREDDPFVYNSRKIGPVYVDVRQLSTSPQLWGEVVDEIVSLLQSVIDAEKFHVISGGEVADLLFSIPVALRIGKPHITVRKAEKGYGMGGRIVGALQEGQKVVHVSDLITSGTSAVDWVRVIREAGGLMTDYFTVFDRNQGGGERLASLGVRLHSLVSLSDKLLRDASSAGMISKESVKGVSSYLADPDEWARAFLTTHPEALRRLISVKEGRLTRKEGLEVVTIGYPSLIQEMSPFLRTLLNEEGLREPFEAIGYYPD